MPTDNQPAKSYITAVLARADAATEDGAPQYRVEEHEDGFLLTWLVVNKNNDELERWEAWIPQGGYVDKERQARNVATLLNQCDAETKHARQDIETLAKIALRAIKTLEGAAISQCDCESDGRMIRAAAAKALADINALAKKGSQ